MGGGGNSFFERYPGRVIDIDALCSFYPFHGGTISDGKGCYIGHRVEDCTAVYKNFTGSPDNQTMIVVGSSDKGKSSFIKGLIINLLMEGFRLFVFDVDVRPEMGY